MILPYFLAKSASSKAFLMACFLALSAASSLTEQKILQSVVPLEFVFNITKDIDNSLDIPAANLFLLATTKLSIPSPSILPSNSLPTPSKY